MGRVFFNQMQAYLKKMKATVAMKQVQHNEETEETKLEEFNTEAGVSHMELMLLTRRK